MPKSFRHKSAGESSLAPVLLLVLIVALPTAAVLWLDGEATENERLAVRQRLADVYRIQLETARQRIAASWRQSLAELDKAAADLPPARAFAAGVRRGIADSLIISTKAVSRATPTSPQTQLRRSSRPSREVRSGRRPGGWSSATATILRRPTPMSGSLVFHLTTAWRPIAIQSQVRSLLEAGDKPTAVKLLVEQVEQSATHRGNRTRRAAAFDRSDAFVGSNCEGVGSALASTTAAAARELEDYDHGDMTAAQRLFHASRELQRLFPPRARADAGRRRLGGRISRAKSAIEPRRGICSRRASKMSGKSLRPAAGCWRCFERRRSRQSPSVRLTSKRLPPGVQLSVVDPRNSADSRRLRNGGRLGRNCRCGGLL